MPNQLQINLKVSVQYVIRNRLKGGGFENVPTQCLSQFFGKELDYNRVVEYRNELLDTLIEFVGNTFGLNKRNFRFGRTTNRGRNAFRFV